MKPGLAGRQTTKRIAARARAGLPWLARRASVMLGISVFAATALAAPPEPAASSAPEKISVRVDFTPAGTHGALHLALAKGWFRDAGLDVDLQDGKGSLSTLQLVGAGHVEIGQISVGMVPVAQEGGLKVRSIAGFARRGDLALLVPKDLPYKQLQDLRGKRIVVFTASPWTPFIDQFLNTAAMTRKDLQVVNVDVNAFVTNYAAGQADGILTLAPFSLPMLEKMRPSRAIDAADSGIVFPGLGLVTRDDVIAARPEAVKKVVQVTIRAWSYIYAGHVDEAVDAIMKNRPDARADPDMLKGQIIAYKAYFDTPATVGKPIGWQSEQDWADAIKTMTTAGVIKPGHHPADFYTNQFVPD